MKKYILEITFVVVALLIVSSIIYFPSSKDKPIEISPVIKAEPVLKFGLEIDSFVVEEGRIQRNQNLSDILSNFGVSMAKIDRLAKNSRDTFDVRKIKAGNKFHVFQSRDSLREAQFFVYENSPFDYVVFNLKDSLNANFGRREVISELKEGTGVIESSLWNTMYDNNLNPILAIELSDIFAWTIDFFGIQKGDRFRVIYEEQFVDSTSVGIGTIHAVQFDHMGQANYAFRFFQDERYDYFDENGNSLRKAFLKAPLNFSRISSRYSNNRYHPVLKIRRPHRGVDYAAPRGTPVVSIGDGTVVAKAYQKGGGGNYIRIKHNSVYTTTYMHLHGYAKGMHTGVRVKQGQVIGYVGSTGLASGPHLDFRVNKNGQYVDPLKVKAPPVEPVKEENMESFILVKDSLLTNLEKINWAETPSEISVN